MTPLKKILIIVAAVAALLALVVALTFMPAVQKWALKRALPGAEAEHVSAGMRSAEVRNLTFVQDGARITVPSATAEYSAWGYLTGGGIQVSKIAAKGVVVDLREYVSPTADTPATKGFEGILGAIALPAGLRLEAAEVDAEVILPSAGSPDGARLKLSIDGGGVGPDREASFKYKVVYTDPAEGTPVPSVSVDGTLEFKALSSGRLEKLGFYAAQSDAPDSEKIHLLLEFEPNEEGQEAFDLGIHGPFNANRKPHQFLHFRGRLDAAKKEWICSWSVSVDSERLAALINRNALPEFQITGEGNFSHETVTGDSMVAGDLKASLNGMERVLPELAHLGRLTADAFFSASTHGEKIELLPSRVKISTEHAVDILAVETIQYLEFDPATGRLAFKHPEEDLATVAFNALPIAWFMPEAGGFKLGGGEMSGGFLVQADPTGAHVSLRASRPLTIESLTVSDSTQTLLDRGTFTTTMAMSYSTARIETVAESWTLTTPAGDRLEGSLRASYVPGMKLSAEFSSTMRGTLTSLLRPFSPVDIGTVSIESTIAGSLDGNNLGIATAQADIRNAAGASLLSQRLLQPLRLDMESLNASVENPSSPAASVSFGSLPLGWVEPFVPNSAFGGVVESGAIDFMLTKDGPSIATTEPVVLRAVSVALEKKPLVDRVDLTWDGTAAMNGKAMSATIRSLDVRQGSTQLLSMKGVVESNGETDPKLIRVTAKGTLDANIGALLAQPAAADWRVLEAGTVSASFDIAAAGSTKVAMKVEAKGLVATQDRTALGDVTLTADATVTPDNDGEFRVPLTVVNSGRKSDVTLSGRFSKREEKVTLNALVAGDTIHLDDFKALAALAPTDAGTASTPAAPTGPRNTTRDAEPFWAGADGTFDIDIKNLVGATDKPITNLRARAAMTPDRVALENFSGNASGGQVTASGALRFVTADREPYALDAKFRVPGLDMATIFTAEAPGKPPTLETVVVAEGSATGRGLNLDDLIARVQGSLDVTGGKGVYRGLARSSDLVSTGAGLLGALLGGQKVQDTTQAVSELATQLRELRFDQMKLKLARGSDLKLNIETLELLSPTMRLSGKGVVNMDPDLPLARQSQRLEMRIGFKDTLGERMIARRMTDGTIDDLGYARFRVPILLTGNLLSPDSKQFWESVTRSMMEMGVQSFLGGG